MLAFSVSASDDKALLAASIPGFDFQFYTNAAVYDGSVRLYSKPSGAFTMHWRLNSYAAENEGVFFAALYEKEDTENGVILKPLEIHWQSIYGGDLLKNSLFARPSVKMNFQNTFPDKAYVLKAAVLDKNNLRPIGVSYSDGGINYKFSTFYLDDESAYYDQDGN